MNPDKLYSSIANSYDLLLWLSGYTLAIDYFVNRLPFDATEPIKVLDAGCGTGLYSFAVLSKYPGSKVVAFDLNEAMVGRFKARLAEHGEIKNRVELFTADVAKPLSLACGSFDLVITCGVLEYVDIERAVENLSTHLTAGGYFLNVAVSDNIFGKVVGKMYGLEPNSGEKNLRAFTDNGFVLAKAMFFPPTRQAYLFKKT